LGARSKVLLLVSVLSTCVGLAALPTSHSGPGEAEPLAGSEEAAAFSDTGSPVEATVELPTPPPWEPAADAATLPPAEPAAASDPGVLPPAEPALSPAVAPAEPALPSAAAPAPPAPPVAPAAPPAPVAPSMPADAIVPLERAALKPVLMQAAADNGLPSDLVMAQAWAESSWQDSVVSSADAVGVLQITAPTVDFVSHQLLSLDHPLDALNPVDNARMGTRYLRHLLGKTDNNLRQALIAYNQGLGALRRNGPYAEAERYADRVIALRPLFATK
jgi:soluble lytic murein transglycosylase-like protein